MTYPDQNLLENKYRAISGERVMLIGLSIVLLTHLISYWSTFQSIVMTWWSDSTFAHGFLILPIVLYLIWQKREGLLKTREDSGYWAFVLLLALVILWLLAKFIGIRVGEQLAVVSMVPVILWQLFGKKFVSIIAFPLAYLFFCIPFGAFLVPHLQDLTAVFTVNALRFLGMPVYLEGRFFYIPSGSFEVAAACSGIRYLIASIALGSLYAYISYNSNWRRLLFLVIAIVIPIIANSIRAFGIVMLADLSNYKIAVGVDHVIYGWLFFGVIILFMFWVGSKFSDKEVSKQKEEQQTAEGGQGEMTQIKEQSNKLVKQFLGPKELSLKIVFLMLVLVAGPVVVNVLESKAASVLPENTIKLNVQNWSESNTDLFVQPEFIGANEEYKSSYLKDRKLVQLYVANYRYQQQGEELINSNNKIYDPELWQRTGGINRKLLLSDGSVWDVTELSLKNSRETLILWYWYDVSGMATASPLKAKYFELITRLKGERVNSSAILVSANYDVEPGEARDKLTGFLNDELQNIRLSLNR